MPNVWPLVPLGEVLTERQEEPSAEDLLLGNIPIVAKVGFNHGQIEIRTTTQTKTGMILVRPGDLLVSGINAAKGAIAVYGSENEKPIAATIHYGAYIPNKERTDVRFLWWLLRSRTFRELLVEYVPGGIKTELKAKRLLPVTIPLPPLDEQWRIVARIEALAAKIQSARQLRHNATEEVGALHAAALSAALGNVPIEGHLGDILLSAPRNGWSVRCNSTEGGIPVLSLAAVTRFQYKPTEFKTTAEPTMEGAHYWLRRGDLLITRSNTPELVGHAAIYDGTPSPCIYPDLMMRLDVDTSCADTNFVHRWLMSTPVREYIASAAKGTSPTMKKIGQGTVMKIPFPSRLPLPEQRRIVAYLDGLQAKVDALKKLQAETAAELDALLPSILDKAFKGEL